MFVHWETVVALAREVSDDCKDGTVDVSRVSRLARAIVSFQQGMLGQPPSSYRPAPEEEVEPGRRTG